MPLLVVGVSSPTGIDMQALLLRAGVACAAGGISPDDISLSGWMGVPLHSLARPSSSAQAAASASAAASALATTSPALAVTSPAAAGVNGSLVSYEEPVAVADDTAWNAPVAPSDVVIIGPGSCANASEWPASDAAASAQGALLLIMTVRIRVDSPSAFPLAGSRFPMQTLGAWATNATAYLASLANSTVSTTDAAARPAVASSLVPAPVGGRRSLNEREVASVPVAGSPITAESMRAAGLSALEAAALPVVLRLWRAFEPHFLRSEAALSSASGAAFSVGTVAAAVVRTPPAASSIAYGALKTWLEALAAQVPGRAVYLYAVVPAEAPSYAPSPVLPALVSVALNLWVVVGACLGGVAGCCCLFFIVAAVRHRRRQREAEKRSVAMPLALAARAAAGVTIATSPNPAVTVAAAAAAIARAHAARVAAEARTSVSADEAGDVAVPTRPPSRRTSFAPSTVPSLFVNVNTYSSAASVAAAGDATPMGSPARVNIIDVAGSGSRPATASSRRGSRSVMRLPASSARTPRVRLQGDVTGVAGASDDESVDAANDGDAAEVGTQHVELEDDSLGIDSPRVAPAPVSITSSSGRLSRFPSAISIVGRPAVLTVPAEDLAGEAPHSMTPRVRSGSTASITRPIVAAGARVVASGSGARATRAARVAAALTPLSVEFATASPGGCPTSPGGLAAGHRSPLSPRTPAARRRASSRSVRRSGFGPLQAGVSTPTPTSGAGAASTTPASADHRQQHRLQIWPSNFGASVPTGTSGRRPRLTSSGLAIDSPARRASVCSLSTPQAAVRMAAGGTAASLAPTPASGNVSGASGTPARSPLQRAGVIVESGVMLMQRGAHYLLAGVGAKVSPRQEQGRGHGHGSSTGARGGLGKHSSFFSLPVGELDCSPSQSRRDGSSNDSGIKANPETAAEKSPERLAENPARKPSGNAAKKSTLSHKPRVYRSVDSSSSWLDATVDEIVADYSDEHDHDHEHEGEGDGDRPPASAEHGQAPPSSSKPRRRRSSIASAVAAAAAALLMPPSLQPSSAHSPRGLKSKDCGASESAQSPSISALRSPGGFLVAHATAALHAVTNGIRSRRGSVHDIGNGTGTGCEPSPAAPRSRRGSIIGSAAAPVPSSSGRRPSLASASSSSQDAALAAAAAAASASVTLDSVEPSASSGGLLRRLARRVFGRDGQGQAQHDVDGEIIEGGGPWIPEGPRSSAGTGGWGTTKSRRGSLDGSALPPLKKNPRFADIAEADNEGLGEATPMTEAEADALARGMSGLAGVTLTAQ